MIDCYYDYVRLVIFPSLSHVLDLRIHCFQNSDFTYQIMCVQIPVSDCMYTTYSTGHVTSDLGGTGLAFLNLA